MSFIKHASPGAAGDFLHLEALGLAWLREAEATGGARVVDVRRQDGDRLELERIATITPTVQAAEVFGRALARTHAAGAGWFGQAPPGWEATTGTIGQAPLVFTDALPNDADGAMKIQSDWGIFYADKRIRPYLDMAIKRGWLAPETLHDFERVRVRLVEGDFTSPQPGLVQRAGFSVARIHGDLWSGNVLWNPPVGDDSARPWTGAVLIDPAAQGGHAETDLAMLQLFGAPHVERILAAYDETSPLADGWRERVSLHQLHPLAVHAALFGPSYGREVAALLRRYR